MQQFTGILGILAILGACWGFSTNRKAVKWKIVAWGICLQLIFAFISIGSRRTVVCAARHCDRRCRYIVLRALRFKLFERRLVSQSERLFFP